MEQTEYEIPTTTPEQEKIRNRATKTETIKEILVAALMLVVFVSVMDYFQKRNIATLKLLDELHNANVETIVQLIQEGAYVGYQDTGSP